MEPMLNLALPDSATQIRILKFLTVGATAAAIQVVVLRLLKGRMKETLAFSVSWLVSTCFHYCANRFWALPSTRQDAGQQLGEYLVAVGLSYVINLGMFKLLRNKFKLSQSWSSLLAIPPSTIVVFLILNYRVFGK
jgi:putative flippase GtrA